MTGKREDALLPDVDDMPEHDVQVLNLLLRTSNAKILKRHASTLE